MQTENRLFDDLVRVLNGAAGTVAGMTREAQAGFQERMKDWIGGMDFVSREEFEAVKAMAIAARDENDLLRTRIAALEAAAAPASGGATFDENRTTFDGGATGFDKPEGS
jgi:BMFP domain-containing protein YqiC